MLIPKHNINVHSNSPPPTFCSRSLWNALATGGLAVMTGLWWINVKLFISDWASSPLLPPPPLEIGPSLHDSWRCSERAVVDVLLMQSTLLTYPDHLMVHSGISSALYLLLANYFLGPHSHSNWCCAAASPLSAAPSASLSTFFLLLLSIVLIPLFFIVLQKPSN